MSKSMKQQFTDWVGTQSGAYDYDDRFNCAFAQFLKASGYAQRPVVEGPPEASWCDAFGERHLLPPGVDAAVAAEPHTFKALAERLAA